MPIYNPTPDKQVNFLSSNVRPPSVHSHELSDIESPATYYVFPDVEPTIPWPDPTPEMLDDPVFNTIWNTIKTWDINVPNAYGGYCGATGNHARAIYDALEMLCKYYNDKRE